MGLFLLIAGAVAVGHLIAKAIVYCLSWLKERIKTIFANKNIKKVAAMSLEKLVNECDNQVELTDFLNNGYTDVIASIDNYGHVDNVEMIKNIGFEDPEIDRAYGSEEMIVIKR